MALLNLGDDPWLLEYESCERLQRDIMEQLMARQKESKNSERYARISANVRLRLKQYNNEVNQLRDKLKDVTKSRSITLDEIERRTRHVELLKTKSMQMEKTFNEITSEALVERTQLMGTSQWGSNDDELIGVEPEQQSIQEIRAQKDRMLQDQERGLDNLSKIIARQKNIAETISTEVDLQNDIIDDLGEHIERTDGRLHNETRHIGVIDRKDKTCIYWVIIVLLFFSIITVVAL